MYSTRNIQVVDAPATRALERSRRPCSRNLPVVNPADGCLNACLFCPARHRSPDHNEIRLRTNLPELLDKELAARRRDGKLPPGILFNTGTDSFQPIEPLLALAHEAMKIVLQAGCELHFATRGTIPEDFLTLFGHYPGRVHAQVSLFSMDGNLVKLYEPNAPGPQERLDTMRALMAQGVNLSARLDPLIPFLSDTVGHLEDMARHLQSARVPRVVATYLVLRPQMLERFQEHLPAAHYHIVKGSFKGQAWRKVGIHQMTRLLPERTRAQGYARLRSIAKRTDLDVSICACSNPSLGMSCLSTTPDVRPNPPPGQLDLFQSV